MPTLKTYSAAAIIDHVINRFKPRDLIIARPEVQTLRTLLEQAIQKLNDYAYQTRFGQADNTGAIEMSKVTAPGVEAKNVVNVYATQQLETIFSTYSQVIGQTPFYFNIIRNQDMFLDFLYTKTLQDNINRKFKNKDTGFMMIGDKLYLDPQIWSNYATVTIRYYPHFKEDALEWQLFDVEANFLRNYLEGLIMYQEGRAQSELGFTDLTTNWDKYMTDGTAMMDKVEKQFLASARIGIGYRF